MYAPDYHLFQWQDCFIPKNEILTEFKNAIHVGGWENVMRVMDFRGMELGD